MFTAPQSVWSRSTWSMTVSSGDPDHRHRQAHHHFSVHNVAFAANQTSELAVKALDAWLYGGKHAWRQYHDPRRPKKS